MQNVELILFYLTKVNKFSDFCNTSPLFALFFMKIQPIYRLCQF